MGLFYPACQRLSPCRGGSLCPPGHWGLKPRFDGRMRQTFNIIRVFVHIAHSVRRAATGSRPYLANNDNAMQVVWHDFHLIQFDAWIMLRHLVPGIVDHLACIVGQHMTITYCPKKVRSAMRTDRDSIIPRLRIIVVLFALRLSVKVHGTERLHNRRFEHGAAARKTSELMHMLAALKFKEPSKFQSTAN